jgi:hypothetical protein
MKPILVACLLGVVGCAADPVDDGACEPDEQDCGGTDDASGKADGAATPGSTAQMNDLTMVMPLATKQADFDAYLAATAAGAKGTLLPKTPYTTQFPDPHGGGIGSDVGMTYGHLRVVAVRFDPCFAQIGPITDPATCDNQIRLVLQDLSFQGGGTSAIDGAVHAFYRVDRTELVKAIREVIDLRKANGQTKTLGPLAPHPLIVKQGQAGAFAQGLAKIILEHCGGDNLIRFTHFQSSNLQTVWGFGGFDVAGTKATAMVVPTLPSKSTSSSFFAGFAAPIAGGFTPETTSGDDVAVLVNVTTAKAAKKAAAQDAFEASLRIENPGFHSPNTIDCASCHVAQSARLLIGEDVLHLTADDPADAFVADKRYVSKTNAKATTSPRGQSFNVHMLSYRNSSLLIGQRVINETASVVAYVNGALHP